MGIVLLLLFMSKVWDIATMLSNHLREYCSYPRWYEYEPRWFVTYSGKPNSLEGILSQCHSVHNESHMNRPGQGPRPQWWEKPWHDHPLLIMLNGIMSVYLNTYSYNIWTEGMHVIFLVLAEVSMKKTVFLDVAPSNLVEIDRSLRGAYYESSVYF
jgi:hypothetical protein